jgi:hopene-associated glycosyltransferase HpnB
VDIIVPARNEAVTIQAVIASLLAQDYTGIFSVTLVDDNSSDGTAHAAGAAHNLTVIPGQPKPSGWSGKLWALRQGIEATSAPVILFTDGDVVHDRRHLSTLVARLLSPASNMVSEMVRLSCTSAAERFLVPAYVYFFQLLYPFSRVNNPRSSVAAAAGGTMLVRRNALERAGGIDAIKGALIDDVALAKIIKASGPILLAVGYLADDHPNRIYAIAPFGSAPNADGCRPLAGIPAASLDGAICAWLGPCGRRRLVCASQYQLHADAAAL